MLQYNIFAFLIFFIGLVGLFVTRQHLIVILMCIELALLGINLNFIVYSVYLDDVLGQLFSLMVLTIAAAESAIGLAILVVYYRIKGSIASLFISNLKG